MKRLIIGILAALIMVFFSQCSGDKCSKAPYSTVYKTLNGVDANMAGLMIEHFRDMRDNDKNPLPESVWLSKDMIHNIVVLLESEISEQKAQGQTNLTDGIRIYFACDTSVHSYPLKTSILLVSTRENGPSSNPSCISRHLHHDYYEHCSAASLFDLKSYGQICNDGAKCQGDSLYFTCATCNYQTDCQVTPHDIRRDTAERMVQRFTKYHHSINSYSAWFDLDLFKIIDQDTTHNGVHIYFATHAKGCKPQYYSFRDTFIITVTKDKNGVNADYFDCLLAQHYAKLYSDDYSFAHISGGNGGEDNAELCPDNCN